jgi:hypothetical protein
MPEQIITMQLILIIARDVYHLAERWNYPSARAERERRALLIIIISPRASARSSTQINLERLFGESTEVRSVKRTARCISENTLLLALELRLDAASLAHSLTLELNPTAAVRRLK